VNKDQKEQTVKALEEKFSRSSSAVFVEFKGLSVHGMEDLRRRSRQAHVEFQVLKNTLAERAFHVLNLTGGDRLFIGPTAVAFGVDDPVIPIKVMKDFAKDNPQVVLKGGVIEGRLCAQSTLGAIADLPPREMLLSHLLMQMQAPLTGLVNTLSAPIRGLINCLKALEQKKSQA